MSYKNKLDELGITLTRTGLQTCPNCSHMRKAENKNKKCLKVTFESNSVKYHCHNGCGFEGVVDMNYTKPMLQEPKKIYKTPAQMKKEKELKPMYDFFESRGIKQKIVEDYNIFLASKWIVFPYTINGKNHNNKARGLHEKTFRQTAGAKPTLFGLDQVPADEKTLYWVEGEMDVLSCAEVGKYAVSPNQGASDKKLECISNCFDFVESFDTHVIAVDSDEAGKTLFNNLKSRLIGKRLKSINWKELNSECKDANDYLLKTTRQDLLNALNSAEEIMYEGLSPIAYDRTNALDFYHGRIARSYSTGLESLDDILKLQTKRLMVVSGHSTKGKSFFIDNILFNTAKLHGWKHLVCSFEGDPNDQMRNFAQMHRRKKLFGKYRMSEDEFVNSLNWIDDNFIRFSMDKRWTIEEILQGAEYAVRRYGIKTLTIDPYNKVQSTMQSGGREDQYIADMLSKIILFAKKFDVLVIFAAHPKTARGEEKHQTPTMYDVSGGGNWLNMCDQAIIIHRFLDENKQKLNQTQIVIEKVKDSSIGNTAGGTVYANFSNKENRLIDLQDGEEIYESNLYKTISKKGTFSNGKS